ncbi:MAG: hypothetical protein LBD78_09805 [Spirochaetaceae bacterium]|jgi:hypothetical protein|nr:hypothetical protein [Spirochaetaceae bacterium]
MRHHLPVCGDDRIGQVLRSHAWLRIFSGVLFLTAGTVLQTQEPSLEELLPGLKERAVVVDMVARIVEGNQEEVWNSANSKVTIPGRPVGLKLVGTNVVVAVQFTPYRRRDGRNILVAQGQIWINVPNQGIRYQTTMESIPLEFGEQIYFFPLGSLDSPDEARIEIQLELRPYMKEQPIPTDEQGRTPGTMGVADKETDPVP